MSITSARVEVPLALASPGLAAQTEAAQRFLLPKFPLHSTQFKLLSVSVLKLSRTKLWNSPATTGLLPDQEVPDGGGSAEVPNLTKSTPLPASSFSMQT